MELENYFKSTIIPQIFIDADLILRKYSPPAIKQFKLTENDLGKPLQEISNILSFSPLIMKDIDNVITNNIVLEKEIQTTDNKWYQMNIIPYFVQSEKRTNGVIATFIDINHRINALKELEILNQNLIKLNSEHETFIFSVSHDLKAPLNNIDGLIQNLIEATESRDIKEIKTISSMLTSSVQDMKNMISELTDISKIGSGYKEKLETVNFNEILEEVKLTLKENIYETNAEIISDFKITDIKFSKKNLRSILFNLISNAIKYRTHGRDPEIFIKTEILKDHLVLSVKDNGLGIENENKEIIFNQFKRIHKDVEGSGVGLYIVKRIVYNAEGKIEVESELGKGTEFKIYLKYSN